VKAETSYLFIVDKGVNDMSNESKKRIKFPCPSNNHKETNLYECEYCGSKNKCDTHITMINEDFDEENE
jgi:hypothetical protein